MTSLLVWCASHLHGKQLTNTLNKTPYFHLRISIYDVICNPLCCRASIRLLNLAPVWNVQFLAISVYHNLTTS